MTLLYIPIQQGNRNLPMREVVNLYHLMRNGDFQRSNQENSDLQMTSIWAPPAKANTIILLDIRSIAIPASNPMRMAAR
jgi:hypothetical protein